MNRTFYIIKQTKRQQALALLRKANGSMLNQPARIAITEFGPDGAIAMEVTFADQADEKAFWTGLTEFPELMDVIAG